LEKLKINNIDKAIQDSQKKFHNVFISGFTFVRTLPFLFIAGGSFAFLGRDCHGMIKLNNPLIITIIMLALSAGLIIYLFMRLSILKLLLFAIFTLCSFYIAYESYGLYSIGATEYNNACKPILYADSKYGYFWAFAPVTIVVCLCIILGKLKEMEEQRETDN
jgi:hypothetical protein